MEEKEKWSRSAAWQQNSGKVLQMSDSSCYINASPGSYGFFGRMSWLSNPAEVQFSHSSDRADWKPPGKVGRCSLMASDCWVPSKASGLCMTGRSKLISASHVAARGYQKSCYVKKIYSIFSCLLYVSTSQKSQAPRLSSADVCHKPWQCLTKQWLILYNYTKNGKKKNRNLEGSLTICLHSQVFCDTAPQDQSMT